MGSGPPNIWAMTSVEDRVGSAVCGPGGPTREAAGFPSAGFWYDGRPVVLKAPPRTRSVPTRTASGSVVGPAGRAKTALASRIYVEGRHNAELVETIWGDDLRNVGVVVEHLGGIDDLPGIVADFAPGEGRRLGILVAPGAWEQGVAPREPGPGRGWPRSRAGTGSSVCRHMASSTPETTPRPVLTQTYVPRQHSHF